MKYLFVKLTLSFGAILFFSLSPDAAVRAQTAAGNPAEAPVLLSGKTLAGAWKLNDEESDDAVAKVAVMLATKSPAEQEGAANAQSDLPAMTISLFHPESVVVAGENNSEITVNQTYPDVIQTRTLITDGVTRFYELAPGVIFSVTAAREKENLRVETVSPRGNKMIETFALAAGSKLSVTMRIENPKAQEIITMHRVYNRTILDIFSNEEPAMQ